MSRRQALVLGAAGLAAPALGAAEEPLELLPLWPGLPPGAPVRLPHEEVIERAPPGGPHDRVAVAVARPLLAVCRPRRPNGAAVLLIPGGAFVRVALDKEGLETGRWLAARGVTAFVLRYRLPGDGWHDRAQVPLQDAQRAMRVIRAGARRFAIDPARLGVIGFSAGGHVAAMLSVSGETPSYAPIDAIDRQPLRPLVAGLVYPVITMGPFAHPGSRDQLLGPAPSAATLAAFSAEQRVGPSVPPTTLFHAGDDSTVPLDNSLLMYAALRRARVPSELHLFEEGGHGFGLRLPPTLAASRWPDLFMAFAGRHGLTA